MNSIESARASVEIIKNAGCDLALLQCTNLYPSPPDCIAKGISELRSAFPEAVIGFSDHSIFIHGSCCDREWSLLVGASLQIQGIKGPDISCSMDPAELSLIVRTSGEIWQALQNNKGLRGDEKVTYNFARASVVADKTCLRCNFKWGRLVGKKARQWRVVPKIWKPWHEVEEKPQEKWAIKMGVFKWVIKLFYL